MCSVSASAYVWICQLAITANNTFNEWMWASIRSLELEYIDLNLVCVRVAKFDGEFRRKGSRQRWYCITLLGFRGMSAGMTCKKGKHI